MAHELQLLDLPFVASETITKYYAVELNTSNEGQVDLVDGATDSVIGVAQNGAVAGESVDVRHLGITKWVASAAISLGAKVGCAASGKCVTKSTAGDLIAGIALEAAGADGDIISVLLVPAFYLHA